MKLGVCEASWLSVEGLILECTATVWRYFLRRAFLSSLVSPLGLLELFLVSVWLSAECGGLGVARCATLAVASTPLEIAASMAMALEPQLNP